MRTFITVLVGAIGVVLGGLGAAFFSLAGLDLGRAGFERGLAWEAGESEYVVVIGCVLLLAWLVSLVSVVVLSHVKRPRRGLRVAGRTTVCLSIVIVVGLTVVAVAVLPRQYDYMLY